MELIFLLMPMSLIVFGTGCLAAAFRSLSAGQGYLPKDISIQSPGQSMTLLFRGRRIYDNPLEPCQVDISNVKTVAGCIKPISMHTSETGNMRRSTDQLIGERNSG